MESRRGDHAVTSEDVACLARIAGLRVAPERLEHLAELLEPALLAADRAAVVASRVKLARALGFDPAWSDEERGA